MSKLSTNGPRRNAIYKKIGFAGAVVVLVGLVALGSPKRDKNPTLPDFVWQARSVAVEILPDSPEPADDPLANSKARENVEKAFLKWGRFRVEQEISVADLVIAVRKGTGKMANATINGGPIDSRPGTVETTDGTIRVGGHTGGQRTSSETEPTPGMEVGASDDRLEVSQSGSGSPVWKYSAKDGLKAPGMAAVGKFREAVEEAEQAAKDKQQAQKKTP